LQEENAAMSREMNLAGGSSFIAYDDILKLKYTAKVVQESIRLANIVPFIFRVAHRDVEYAGYTIPKGWRVLVWLRSIHTDTKYYPDPLTFNPDRWDVSPLLLMNKLNSSWLYMAYVETINCNMKYF
jgi:ent-kaurenoic acid hydroxylase